MLNGGETGCRLFLRFNFLRKEEFMKKTGNKTLPLFTGLAALFFFLFGAVLTVGAVDGEEYCIDIEKLVSVDDGESFTDADTVAEAPVATNGVLYKLVVGNCGEAELTDVTVTDGDLGINENIGTLEPGETRILTKDDAGFYNLDQPDRCTPSEPSEEVNTANVTGIGCGPKLEDCDKAWVKCEAPKIGCRVTAGGNDTFEGNYYTYGGEAGANTALQPQPKGNWTHHQKKGPDGHFIFHAGTASAPPGTEIDVIVCSDPGGCKPSGDPPSPAKQIDFAGVGTFKNIKNPSDALESAIEKETYHWFEVHMEDLGEPAANKNGDLDNCPVGGSGTDAFDTPPDFEPADCDCPNFYRIRIFEGVIPVFDTDTGEVVNVNKQDIIYEVYGYVEGGNLQIHRLTGFDRKSLPEN